MRRVATALALLATSLAWVSTATPASAQEQGRITGIVRSSETQRPLSGAQVFIQGTRIGGLSNAEGRYLISGVPAGTHQVELRFEPPLWGIGWALAGAIALGLIAAAIWLWIAKRR